MIREIETDTALKAITQQLEHKVVIPDEEDLLDDDIDLGVMIADNIDELESTDSGFGTSHRVNSILVTRGRKRGSSQDEEQSKSPPTKKKCLRSLPKDMVEWF